MGENGDYGAFLGRKAQLGGDHGFDPELPSFLFDFQRSLLE